MSIWIIVGIIIAIIILLSVVAYLIGVSRSGKTKTINPTGTILGKALIVYDAGLTGGTKAAAGYMAEELKSKNYEVKLAGVRSNDALNIEGYDILIIGSPNYGSRPTKPVESYLNHVKPTENITVGVYSLSGGSKEATNLVMAQILKDKSISVKVSNNYGNTSFGAGDKKKYKDFISEILS